MIIIKTADILSGINVDTFEKAEPILWFYNGMFCIIPIQTVQNAIDMKVAYQKFPKGRIKQIAIEIIWNDGIPIDPKVGYALMGE